MIDTCSLRRISPRAIMVTKSFDANPSSESIWFVHSELGMMSPGRGRPQRLRSTVGLMPEHCLICSSGPLALLF
jgi:hypothetical protein